MMAASRHYRPPEEFTLRLRERLPMNVCFSFTSEQLEALRRVFGERLDGEHTLDLRGRWSLPWSRYYLVLQTGRDRRTGARRGAAVRTAWTPIDRLMCGLSIAGLAAGLVWLAMNLP